MITKSHFLLICKVAHGFHREDAIDDLISEGCIALVRCANRFNGKNRLDTYAIHRIRGTMIDYLSTLKEKHNEIPIDYPANVNVQYDVEKSILLSKIDNAMKSITNKQRQAVCDYYYNGETLKEIAKKNETTECGASQLVKRGVSNIKRMFE